MKFYSYALTLRLPARLLDPRLRSLVVVATTITILVAY